MHHPNHPESDSHPSLTLRRFPVGGCLGAAGVALLLLAASACDESTRPAQPPPKATPKLEAPQMGATAAPTPARAVARRPEQPRTSPRFELPRKYAAVPRDPVSYQEPVLNDDNLEATIERRLFADPAVRGKPIKVDVTKRVVTLRGQVRDLAARHRAVEVAAGTRGARSVVNQLEIAPVKRTDLEVLRDVRAALKDDPATRAIPVQSTVVQGKAILKGEVGSHAAHELVLERVRNVEGVLEIDDQLTVEAEAETADAELKKKIQRRLRADDRINARELAVKVADRVVTLHGTVATAAEKRYAKRRAHIPGVLRVLADKVVVRYFAPDLAKDGREQPPTDAEIEKAVREALLFDPRVDSPLVKISVEKGYVTLFGRVSHLQAIHAAESDARHTWGVVDVYNYLTVKPYPRMGDRDLAQVAERFIRRDPVLREHDVQVAVLNATARLTGTVPTAYDKERAGDLMARVEGLRGVNNMLQVSRTRSERPDAVLVKSIRDALYWNPYVNEETVDVQVRDGVATLQGKVQHFHAFQSAARTARRAGAWRVKNRLRVRSTERVAAP
jgi:osmotically-inducible protein OsmY